MKVWGWEIGVKQVRKSSVKVMLVVDLRRMFEEWMRGVFDLWSCHEISVGV